MAVGARGEWKESHGAVAIVVHGMFIDILTKVLTGCEMTTGKQPMVFCSQNAGMHVFELKPGTEDNPGASRVCSASTSSITFPPRSEREEASRVWTTVT